jgi:hypothetical protein
MAGRMARRDNTAAAWTSANTILAVDEVGFETDTGKFKTGNGATAWTSLAYADADTFNRVEDPSAVVLAVTAAASTPAAIREVVDATNPRLSWKRGSTQEWLAQLSSSNVLRFRDVVNGRDHMFLTPGSTSELAFTDFNSKLRVFGSTVAIGASGTCIVGTLGTSDGWVDSLTSLNLRAQSGSVFLRGNISLGASGNYGGGVQVVFVQNATTVPTTNPTSGGIMFAEAGALKYRGSSGTVTTIAAA